MRTNLQQHFVTSGKPAGCMTVVDELNSPPERPLTRGQNTVAISSRRALERTGGISVIKKANFAVAALVASVGFLPAAAFAGPDLLQQ